MSDILDKAVRLYVRDGCDKNDKEDVLQAAETQIKEMIIKEIRAEVKAEEKEKARAEIEAEENEKKLEELKDIVWSGFLVAFLVGLLVNQVTDVITHLKHDSMGWTAIIIIIIGMICFITFLYMFLARIKKLYDEIKKKK
jgi:F0F1-type ATP synthase assembly protein I|nr:MAG TPA: Protein of unknown function (DUF1129) [Caudoviricetes sp.]